MAAFAGLRALPDLDLDFVGVDEVRRVDAEASARDLPDARPALFLDAAAVAPDVLAALTAVRRAAEAVERRRDRAVRGAVERAVRHRRPAKARGDDLAGRLDL